MPGTPAPRGGDARAARTAIGAWLREHREFLGVSQEDLRRRLERRGIQVTQSTVSRWESGELAPPGDALPVLASVLGTTLASLESHIAGARARAAVPVDLTGRTVADLVSEADAAAHAGNRPRALALLEAGADLLRLQGEAAVPAEVRAALFLRLARAHVGQWNLEAGRAALRRLAAIEDAPFSARFQGTLVRVFLAVREEDLEEYEALAARVAGEVDGLENEELRCHALHVLGGARYLRDDPAGAIGWLRRAVEGWQKVGNTLEYLRAAATLGYCEAASGDPGGGMERLEKALAESRSRSYRDVEAWALFLLGRAYLVTGKPERGAGVLEDAATLGGHIGLEELRFLSLFHAWQASRTGEPANSSRAAELERRLRRLLPRVPPPVPEVRRFRELAGDSSPAGSEDEEDA